MRTMTTDQSTDSWRILPLLRGVRRRSDLEEMFRPHQEGYLGADGISSIPLGDGRVFWFFGDTLLGRIKDGVRQMDMMPRNTAAIQSGTSNTADSIRWLFRSERGGLKPFVSMSETDNDLWFWAGTIFRIEDSLFLMGYGIAPDEGEMESLSFALRHPIIVRITDLAKDPLEWTITTAISENLPTNPWFCSASYVDGERVYLIGLKTPDQWNKTDPTHAVLASVETKELLENPGSAKFQFWNSKESRWSENHQEATRIFSPGVTESSIYFAEEQGLFVTTSYDAIQGLFCAVIARKITGPWSEPIPLFRVPAIGPEFGAIAYTLRIHPHLSPAGCLVMSYVVNTSSLETILPRTDLYFPRFVEVPLEALIQRYKT